MGHRYEYGWTTRLLHGWLVTLLMITGCVGGGSTTSSMAGVGLVVPLLGEGLLGQAAGGEAISSIVDDGAGESSTAAAKILYLQPLGDKSLSKAAVEEVATALGEFYGFTVDVLPKVPMPKSAYYPPRKRYRAEKLLDFLATVCPADGFRILGITGLDISTTKGEHEDWGIMGLASLDGKVSVMSMYRCKKGSKSTAHANHRFAKVAVHEIGHTLGLYHCPTVGCLMEDAKGTNETVDGEYVLCDECRALLEAKGYDLPPAPKPPWPKP